MEKTDLSFEDFLSQVKPEYIDFAVKTNELLVQEGYKAKVESKAAGFFVSYSNKKTKKSILNFFFRKKGLYVRLYLDDAAKHTDFINNLPEDMEKEIDKASDCKRLINPDDCNPKCIKGYDYSIRNNEYIKCRYSCFQFLLSPECLPIVSEFLENEVKMRGNKAD